ncbi:adenylate/guanylate cyclase [Thecamonas trahens ATCC 50062]|uniref:Adenylate/guanylate cyclase n=1 Tax=Thecamonas trahens ATCC 50062 TaxID=461836 RepID=A0A0L0DKU2_THETB|nr:adenylate/guanylate cyclase [Thecamonas trahens ATCC 50062]KNC51973.1 adenylate/guanylate cyclase [Thecamonas trahens ATCC 50062]|eukprot:XP_013755560.1 adenylate/guanylate cyclase [Thecamonas trahens ATCC 50062]
MAIDEMGRAGSRRARGMADILAYVPDLIVSDCLKEQVKGEGGEWKPKFEAFWGAVVFCDVSGFTKLSERLAAAPSKKEGEGAERLVDFLNDYFSRLLSLVRGHGGDVIKFAGDALLACWPQRDGESPALTVLRAVQASLAIEEHMNVDDEDMPYLHMGISAGDLFLLQVGGTFNRSECILCGPPLLQLSDAVPAASPKFSVLSPEAWALLPPGSVVADVVSVKGEVVGEPVTAGDDASAMPEGGLMRAREVLEGVEPVAAHTHSIEELNEAGMALLLRFVPGSIKAAVAENQQMWLGGSRKASVMFIHVRGIDMSVGSCLPEVHATVLAVQEAVYKYEGSINKILLDDKGFLILAGFGLPPLSHEDDALRAVLSGLRVQAKIKLQGIECDIGITTGTVFCGIVGSASRREYTMMGDVVNTAARYMASAAGGVFCDEPTTAECPPESMQFDEMAPRTFKGKAGVLRVFQPSRKRLRIIKSRRPNKLVRSLETMKRTKACPLVGRHKESSLISAVLSSLKRGDYSNKPGPVLMFEGERGIGKSRVLEEGNRVASKSRFMVYAGRGDSMAIKTLFHPWAPVFRKLLRLPRERESDPVTIALLRQAALATLHKLLPEELYDAIPLLNPVVDPIAFDEPENYASLSDKERVDASLQVLPHMFEILCRARSKAAILILQDYQLFDPPSRLLFNAIMKRSAHHSLKLGAFVSATPLSSGADDPPPEFKILTSLESTEIIPLKALSQSAIAKLVSSRLGVKHLPEAVIDLVIGKCGGNPFFAQELGTALLESGVLARSADGESIVVVDEESLSLDTAGVSLPQALRGVITSRIDKLKPAHLRLLKVAAAMGSNLTATVLHNVFTILDAAVPGANSPSVAELEDGLERLTALSFLTFHDLTGAYQFKTALTQDVVYSLMLASQQQAVHAAIAQYYERVAEADSVAVEALAYHWRHADTSQPVVVNKAIRYLEQAAMACLDQSNPRRALAHLQDALGLYTELARTADESSSDDEVGASGEAQAAGADDDGGGFGAAAPNGDASAMVNDPALVATVKVLLLRVASMASLQIGHLARARRYALQALNLLCIDYKEDASLEDLMGQVDTTIEAVKSSTMPDDATRSSTTLDELRFHDELDAEMTSSGGGSTRKRRRTKYSTLKRTFSEFLQDKERLNSSFSGTSTPAFLLSSSMEWADSDDFNSFTTLDEFRFSLHDNDALFGTDGMDSTDEGFESANDELAAAPSSAASSAAGSLRHHPTSPLAAVPPTLASASSTSGSECSNRDGDGVVALDASSSSSSSDSSDKTGSSSSSSSDGAQSGSTKLADVTVEEEQAAEQASGVGGEAQASAGGEGAHDGEAEKDEGGCCVVQ